MLSTNIHSILWFVIYLSVSISIYIVSTKTKILKSFDYLYILLTTYFACELFMYLFFYLMSPFLGFIITVVTFISSIFLYIETKNISKKASYFVIPYNIYTLYLLILMTIVYFMNF